SPPCAAMTSDRSEVLPAVIRPRSLICACQGVYGAIHASPLLDQNLALHQPGAGFERLLRRARHVGSQRRYGHGFGAFSRRRSAILRPSSAAITTVSDSTRTTTATAITCGSWFGKRSAEWR